jgi:hypothetical protein
MPGFPGSPNILKGAFIRYDGSPAAPRIVIFPYNPETLSRTIVPGPTAAPAGKPNAATGGPQETIVFTMMLDATDQLEQASTQAATTGVYPILSAIELLMYPPFPVAPLVTLFVWGPYRVVPVRIVALNILESLFDPNLSPIQATVQVTLSVTGEVEVPSLGYLLQHVATLTSLAGPAYSPTPNPAGIKLPLPGSVPPSTQTGTVNPGGLFGAL